ncbi:hypothetical protein AAFF_G00275470 [Aldrovandia affinis]|uniref:Uncharacterized protein n=1 Tax=Aldrovandia affinis TaxID=143900 RepID=A0AAD7SRX2_9TELE|nr:hypothetical protein AAFF_G00275470 [Aldrovandia affinis]
MSPVLQTREWPLGTGSANENKAARCLVLAISQQPGSGAEARRSKSSFRWNSLLSYRRQEPSITAEKKGESASGRFRRECVRDFSLIIIIIILILLIDEFDTCVIIIAYHHHVRCCSAASQRGASLRIRRVCADSFGGPSVWEMKGFGG